MKVRRLKIFETVWVVFDSYFCLSLKLQSIFKNMKCLNIHQSLYCFDFSFIVSEWKSFSKGKFPETSLTTEAAFCKENFVLMWARESSYISLACRNFEFVVICLRLAASHLFSPFGKSENMRCGFISRCCWALSKNKNTMHTQSQLIEHSSRGTLGICNVSGGDLWHAQDSPNATLQTKISNCTSCLRSSWSRITSAAQLLCIFISIMAVMYPQRLALP